MTFNFYATNIAKELTGEVDLSKEYTYEEFWDSIPNFSKEDRVVCLDADALVYRISAASDTRSIKVSKNNKSREYSTRTEFKSLCKTKGWDYEDFSIEDKRVSEDVSYCLSTLKRAIKNIKELLNATHLYFFLGGKQNDRCDLPLPIQYKSTRSDIVRPTHLKACREYLIKNHNTFVMTGIEADDVVQGFTQHIINDTEAYGIAWQLDKDFHQSFKPSRYYHPVKQKVVELSGGLGKLWLDGDKVRGEGLKWLCLQLAIHDTSDSYAMNSHYLKRYGEKSFYKDFKDCETENELLSNLIDKWKVLLPEKIMFKDWKGIDRTHDWLSLAEVYMKCCYMKVNPNDDTTFESLLKEYEVEY